MNLAILVRSEILKTKRTASLYFTLIAAAVVPAIILLSALTDDIKGIKNDPLNGYIKLASEMNGLFFFPWFIILTCTLLPQIEYKNNTWKQVFTSPAAKVNIITAKYLTVHLLMLLFLLSTHLFMLIAILLANFIQPTLGLLNHLLDSDKIIANATNNYLTMLAVCSIQFWFGLRFKNFIVPVAIGFTLWLTGTLLALYFNSSIANYFPYSFQVFSNSPQHKLHLSKVVWASVAYAILFSFICYMDLRRKRMNN